MWYRYSFFGMPKTLMVVQILKWSNKDANNVIKLNYTCEEHKNCIIMLISLINYNKHMIWNIKIVLFRQRNMVETGKAGAGRGVERQRQLGNR